MLAETFLMSNSIRKLPGVLALASLLAYPVAAQTPMKEVIDVRVTNVEIIATDSKGNHVPGLTRDDFELYENGKLQPITNFFEAAAGASSDAARKTGSPRRIVIYLDDSTLVQNNRKPLIAALKKLVANAMTPDDQMMIVTFYPSLKVRLPWTSDPAAVQSALDAVGRESGNGRIRQAALDRLENNIRSIVARDQLPRPPGANDPITDFRVHLSHIRAYASSVKQELGVSASALEGLLGELAGVDGRKIVLIASESFPTRPGGEAFAFLDRLRNEVLSGDGPEGFKRGARLINVLSAEAEFNANEIIMALGRIANAAGVSIYGLDPATSGRHNSGNVEQLIQGQLQTGPAPSDVDGLQVLAQATGGLAWIGVRPEVAIEKLRADLGNYYSLGYQARTGGDAERAIEVRPRRADLRVRAKKSIVFRSAEAEMAGRVTSNLQNAQVNDLGISVQVAGEVTAEGEKRRVPIHVLIPARNITVAAEGDVLTGGFSVYYCAADGQAGTSAVTRRSHEIRWTPETVQQLGNDGSITFSMKIFLEKGQDLISFGVLDHRSQATGFSKIEM